MGTSFPPHISVCICTYKRRELLRLLLRKLVAQQTANLFTYSLVVADNDAAGSAREVVGEFQGGTHPEISYFIEREQNIALARNRALANASGDYIAFIDDDEIPVNDWLLRLFETCEACNADGVLGPVKPYFALTPPRWAVSAGFFERPNSREYPSGSVLHWNQTGTGNALVRRRIFDQLSGAFRPEYGSGGEDIDFFRRAMELGKVFVWCAEAVAYESIPAERARISYQLRRALQRGKGALVNGSGRPASVLKSLVACGVYIPLLPISLLLGRSVFLRYLVKTCDHLGKLLSFCGIDLVTEKYVGSDSDHFAPGSAAASQPESP